jgi:hypothetical protein
MESLAVLPDRVEALMRAVPASRLDWTPASWDAVPGEMFTARGQVCHLRDIEALGYHRRISRMLDEVEPDLESLDSYELAERLDYGGADLEQALKDFREARRATLERLAPLTDAQLERTGTFAEYGRLSLRGLVHLLASHDAQHLACLHWLLAKMSAA